ncbi:MAG: roadblock/LC7 domain-containing protein [Promethearchaeota archaeon]
MVLGTENLDNILKKLLVKNLGVKAAAIVSREGLPIASAVSKRIDETRIAAMTSALFSLGRQSIMELGEENLDEIFIQGSDGQLLLVSFGDYGILLLSTEDGFEGFEKNVFSRLGPFKPPGSSATASTIEEDLE